MFSEKKRTAEDKGGHLFFVNFDLFSYSLPYSTQIHGQEMETYSTVPQIQLPVTIIVFIFLNLQKGPTVNDSCEVACHAPWVFPLTFVNVCGCDLSREGLIGQDLLRFGVFLKKALSRSADWT